MFSDSEEIGAKMSLDEVFVYLLSSCFPRFFINGLVFFLREMCVYIFNRCNHIFLFYALSYRLFNRILIFDPTSSSCENIFENRLTLSYYLE